MLDPHVAQLLNSQINKEFYSAYLYLDISNYYLDQNLNGFGHWFRVQAQEERDHALLFITYMQNNNTPITLDTVACPGQQYQDFGQPLTLVLEHERYITSQIHAIYSAALAGQDYRTTQFLDWFIREQGEEERSTEDLLRRFALFGQDAKGLYLLDSELAARAYAPPTLAL